MQTEAFRFKEPLPHRIILPVVLGKTLCHVKIRTLKGLHVDYCSLALLKGLKIDTASHDKQLHSAAGAAISGMFPYICSVYSAAICSRPRGLQSPFSSGLIDGKGLWLLLLPERRD